MRAWIVIAALACPQLAHADPAPVPDPIERARELYQLAEQAMEQRRYADAQRDYAEAYELTHDAVLFYKIGNAAQSDGNCEVAITYFRRYLREGKPNEAFVKLTFDKLAACGVPITSGRGGTLEAPTATPPPPAPAPAAPPPPPTLISHHRLAWIFVASAVGTFTIGAVLAYSANAAERDVSDLYVGLAGVPPRFDARTRATYDDLVAEGERYQTLARISFGVTAALAAAATYRFLTDQPTERVQIAPAVTPTTASVTATLAF